MAVPASRYRLSPRAYAEPLGELVYPDHFERRQTNAVGQCSFRGRTITVSEVFEQQTIGWPRLPTGT